MDAFPNLNSFISLIIVNLFSQNRAKALKILQSKLYQQQLDSKRLERSSARLSQVGGGDRHERIRTYNFPQGRVTDHRYDLVSWCHCGILNVYVWSVLGCSKPANCCEDPRIIWSFFFNCRINITKFGLDSMMEGGEIMQELVDDLVRFSSMQALAELYGIQVRPPVAHTTDQYRFLHSKCPC